MRSFILAIIAVFALAGTADAQARKLTGTRYFDALAGTTVTAATVTADTVTADAYRATAGTAITASLDLDKADVQGASVWAVSTTGGAVDVDFGDDAALDAADVGSKKLFVITAGGTNALTVTAGASGVTTVTTLNTLGTTCEDVGDVIECIVTTTATATCVTVCAD